MKLLCQIAVENDASSQVIDYVALTKRVNEMNMH